MKTPEFPKNEESRLRTLRSLNVLDTLPEERFDRLTRMAKHLFGVPIALVSLIDENRQWFKSAQGLDATETPRDISFCGHAILEDKVFIIPDATKDERFADNPLVVDDPNIRFYAGCPLEAQSTKMGTLCIIDEKPRNFAQGDLEALVDLAAMVESELAAVQLATLDTLTKISNRRGFLALARHSINLCLRQGIPASLVFMDLNDFKPINDTFGHAEGDLALLAFATQMKTAFRNSDVFARLGGDEFVVLLTNASKAFGEQVLEGFSKSIEKYNQEAKRGYNLSFSHGIVEFDPARHKGIDELLADGDALMYHAKQQEKVLTP